MFTWIYKNVMYCFYLLICHIFASQDQEVVFVVLCTLLPMRQGDNRILVLLSRSHRAMITDNGLNCEILSPLLFSAITLTLIVIYQIPGFMWLSLHVCTIHQWTNNTSTTNCFNMQTSYGYNAHEKHQRFRNNNLTVEKKQHSITK